MHHQGWIFCIFGQPGCKPKKSLGAKNPRRREKREERERKEKKRRTGLRRKKREGRSRKRGVRNGRDQ